eukprot:Lithocolla_globosa_v1_NODE_5593_length_1214_cov_14.704918.p1 type:complete len:188 gc:universal NODE_5593_length_1214_cov_14.704918:522-1085(+)
MKLTSDKNKFTEFFDDSSNKWLKARDVEDRLIEAYHRKVGKALMKRHAKEKQWQECFASQIVSGTPRGEVKFRLSLPRRMWNSSFRSAGDRKPRSPARILKADAFIKVMKKDFEVDIKKPYYTSSVGDWGGLQDGDAVILNHMNVKPKVIDYEKRGRYFKPNYANDSCEGFMTITLLLRGGGPGTFV